MATMAPTAPLLAFGPPGWIAWGALAVGSIALTAIAVNEASKSADKTFAKDAAVTAATAVATCVAVQHRGRVQAQGNGLERSIPWMQPVPPTVAQGLAWLAALRASLSPSERAERERAFEQAEAWVRARPPGGVYAIVKKSFPNPPLKGGVRVDIEVLAGMAFLM